MWVYFFFCYIHYVFVFFLTVTSEGGGHYRSRGLRSTTIRYKISYKDILYNTGNIANILS